MSSDSSPKNDQTAKKPAGSDEESGELGFLKNAGLSFLQNIGQEAGSALTSILDLVGHLEVASPSDEELRTRIRRRVERLRRPFQSLKRLARLSRDQVDLDVQEVSAVELAQDLLGDVEPAADEKGTALALRPSPSPIDMTTGAETLRCALRYLLTNAIKSTQEGEVTVHVGATDDTVEFRVEDTGAGMPSDGPSSLFEPFEHRTSGQSPSPNGLGLDLTLAQALAHHLEGTVEVEDKPGGGGAFALRVPRDLPSAVHAKTDKEDGKEPARLLVVEDNDVTRRLLRKMLEANYQVDMAKEATRAIQQAKEKTYDAFVLDVNLKDRRTGVEVLQAVRKMKDYRSTPAVACTAYALDDHRDHFLRAGFDDVVAKPVTKREILDAINHRLDEPSPTEPEDLEASLSGIELPPIPTTLIEVASLASSSDSPDVEALTEALRKDTVVSQWLIRQVNSAYYGLRESIDTIERAVRYLGFQPVCNLVLTKVIGESFSGTDEPEGEKTQQYVLKTSALTAFTAREVAEEIGYDDFEVAYAGGMFAQIGRLAFLEEKGKTYVDLWFEERDRSATFEGPPPQGQEILHFEEDYVEKGLAVGRECGLSDQMEAVLWNHHRPERASKRFGPLVPIVALAFKVAHHADDLEDENPWGGEETLASDLREFQVTRHVAEQGPLSEKKLVPIVVDIAGNAKEFVDEVSGTA